MKTVLIVDDSRTTRDYHAAIISSGGFRAVTAADGADALERLMSEAVDVVVTDVNMPRMDGYELVRRIRAKPGWEALPVIMLSTDARDTDRRKGFAAGANLYIGKPSNPDVLLDNVRMILPEAP